MERPNSNSLHHKIVSENYSGNISYLKNEQAGTVRWLFSVPGRRKLFIVALTLAQAVNGGSGVLYALLMRNIVDSAAEKDSGGFWEGISFILILVLIQLALRAVIRWLNELSKATFENIFKSRLTETLLRKDYLRVNAVHSGEWMNRLTNDTVVVANGYVDILPGLTGMAVKLASALIMIIFIEPRFAAILIPGGLLMFFFTWLFRKLLKRLHKEVQEADGQVRIFLQERIGSLLMIRSFAAEAQTSEETAEKLEAHKAARMHRNHFSNMCNIGFGAAMTGMRLFGIGWCGYGILKGTISFGTLTAINQLITQIQSPFANISGYLPRYYSMLASAERLMDAEHFPDTDSQSKPLSLKEVASLYRDGIVSIGLRDASFAYFPSAVGTDALDKANMPVVLNHISLEIKKGEYVAFTGTSGCGKSTVLKLLMCVYLPDAGERYYINMEGTRHELTSAHRRLFAYVPQGNALMSGTIRDIVSFAAPEAKHDDERLHRALCIACADDFVDGLDNGADTLLGERGTGLSEGQTQRLAIARAVFSDCPILLLDEVTSSLDVDTEKQLLKNLRQLTDKTVITVTHRPAVLSICDRVLRFTENGIITEKHASEVPE